MNRRGFLKAFTKAAVGLAVAPALAKIAPSVTPVTVPKVLPTGGAITYASLEAMYMKCRQMGMQPNLGVVSRSMYRAMTELYPWMTPLEDLEREPDPGGTYDAVPRDLVVPKWRGDV
jgi:hypothetical protein